MQYVQLFLNEKFQLGKIFVHSYIKLLALTLEELQSWKKKASQKIFKKEEKD